MAKRQKKTSRKQYEEMLGFIENNNKILVHGKTNPQNAKTVDTLWDSFALKVNALGYGAPKSGAQWRKVSKIKLITLFNCWKSLLEIRGS